MARGRKTQYIRAVKTTEQRALKHLFRTGVATKHQLETHYGLKGERLQKFVNSQFFTFQQDLVRLDKKGIEYCERVLDMKHRYISSSHHLKHDLKMSEAYARLPEKTQDTWKTENQLFLEAKKNPSFQAFRAQIEQKYRTFNAVPDAAIQHPVTGEWMAFECLTDNYRESDIEQKESFSHTYLNGIVQY